ncbi:MAG: EAL domain-containing protein [Steroidobacteraceae bacterium]|jgi:diguanylate cyclase (GGDEF)-like protein
MRPRILLAAVTRHTFIALLHLLARPIDGHTAGARAFRATLFGGIANMLLGRLNVSTRFLLVLAIGLIFQAAISIGSLVYLRESLVQDRVTEVKHLLESAYSAVVYYHDRASRGLMSDAEARRAAADAVRAMHYDGSNYFFIWDLDGTGIAHGAQPALEGKNFLHSPDADKNPVVAYMVRRLIEVAKSDKAEGVTTYRIPKGGQKVPIEKIAYSRLFEPWGWSIGTGAYVDDIDGTFRARLFAELWLFIGSIVLAGAMTFVIGADLTRALNRLAERVAGIAKGQLEGDVHDVQRADEVGIMARALMVLRDTSREAAELRLDQLTGLPTRKLLMDRLKQVKGRSARSGNYAGLMVVDLDKFKSLNDTYGHDVGDALLREVAQRLSASVREGDTVARLGGDEFVVVVVDIGNDEKEAGTALEVVGTKILGVLTQPYHLGNVTHTSTASVGMTLFKGDGAPAEDLLKQADLAMYKSKDSGRNVCRFFDARMEEKVQERATLEKELREALVANQFQLHYQPHIGPDGELTGAEALVRWKHPRRGLVPPNEFIPIAEETGLIVPLGRWVLETACKQLAQWSSRPQTAMLRLAVNVSAREFQQPDFVEKVVSILQDTAVDPSRLTLELTESLLVHNVDDVIGKMSELKLEGVSFALDDFGIGYSSLYFLKRLPLDQLKIDRSFVRHVLTDPNDAAIANMIVALGQTLGLEVIAEGVETAEQRDFLASSGCLHYQGYFFSRPLPLERFEQFAIDQRDAKSPPALAAWLG